MTNADLLLVNGSVHTVDADNSIVDAVAISDNHILATGPSESIRAQAGEHTQIVDLAGRTVLPGFIDSHVHMGAYGTNKLGIDCKVAGMRSIEAIKQAIRERAQATPPGTWIRAHGYDHTRLDERRHPNRSDLDEAAPDHPVIVVRTCVHIAAANSRALTLAGIGDDTPDPPGGRYERSDGHNAGVAIDAAIGPLLGASGYSRDEFKTALRLANEDFLRAGITSCHDAGAMSDQQIPALLECVRESIIDVRVYFMVWLALGIKQGLQYLDTGLFTGFGNDKLKLGPFKVMTDGASSGPTAATRQPYDSMPCSCGILYYDQEELDELVERAHAAGFQVTAHAVGDRAIEMMLNAYERVLARHPRADHRHRLEHCAICPPDLVRRIAKLGVVPVLQPSFFWEFGDGYQRNYGLERTQHMFPARSLMDAGVTVVGSSDTPVTDHRPLFGIQQALTRATMDGSTGGERERIALAEAIRMYTINGAYASFDESLKGSLEAGKLADLVVLEGRIDRVAPTEIAAIPVAATMVDGRWRFGSV
ncbi:MAG TPA: amidohydrolase [Chloroflexota bacterium]|nr:amidohydrolase [Chloroflexota bacterium]